MSYGFSLGINSPTGDFCNYSEFIVCLGYSKWLMYSGLPRAPIKIFFHGFAIYYHGSWTVSYTHLTLPTTPYV